MINEALVKFIDSILGEQGKKTARGNYSYHCPECNHPKRKLEINFDESSPNYGNFGCWVCGYKSTKLFFLLKPLNLSPSKLEEFNFLYKKENDYSFSDPIFDKNIKISLPKEYKSLIFNENKKALKYLYSRGLTKEDIIKHNIGYCEQGLYSNMIIIPSYNSEGDLNYFMSRSYEKYDNRKINPSLPRDIIIFELFINWDLPIIICEGPFDAITIKRNSIPLLGKFIQPSLMKKLVTSKVDKIYLSLDKDAIKYTLKLVEELMEEGKEVYLVELGDKDPSDLGFEEFTNLVHSTLPITKYKLLELKLSL